jgi:hypothetical protein
VTRAEVVVGDSAAASVASSSRSSWAPVKGAADLQAELGGDLGRDAVVFADDRLRYRSARDGST